MTSSTSQRLSTAEIKQFRRRTLPHKIKQYQQLLKLTDWEIGLSTKKPEKPDSLMEIAMNRRRKHAAIRISDSALLLSREEYETSILHELTHIIFDEMDYEYSNLSNSDFPRYEEARERTVDHLAKVLYSAISN